MAATTGDSRVDGIVREKMTEAIGITRQLLSEVMPDIDPSTLDKLSVSIPIAVMPTIASIIYEGMMIQARQGAEDAQEDDDSGEVQDHAPGRRG